MLVEARVLTLLCAVTRVLVYVGVFLVVRTSFSRPVSSFDLVTDRSLEVTFVYFYALVLA